ncbi:MAG: 4-hydroxy-3-methylbut-2-enyl diphosphate reductase [Bacteroidales bacterium]|jgi:4-hydroxy-3-methylbut-2-enyl diphosphate reductase|nr:4-hydroxy-3-methylbut-2-enyl diphosphate reductase [Bacteroidales bacterium]
MLSVEIDPGSGFCGGVIRAISKAEDSLAQGTRLYSLGAIVHNDAELGRLHKQGLITVHSLDEVPEGGTVLIRAHGEPPSTYAEASARHLTVIDCSCPVVLQLQQRIRDAYARIHAQGVHGRIIIFGQVGHAEVLGLVGQVNGDALVVENSQMLEEAMPHLDFSQPIEIFSQTTKSPREYKLICDMLQARGARLTVHNTICGQVSSRHEKLVQFAESHDIIIFVTGKESSNGKILSALCRSVNPRTYVIGRINEIDPAWFRKGDRVGICGATSTPKWALEAVARDIEKLDCAKN